MSLIIIKTTNNSSFLLLNYKALAMYIMLDLNQRHFSWRENALPIELITL